MKSPLYQIVIGWLLTMGVMSAIDSRSIDRFTDMLWPALFFVALGLSGQAKRSQSHNAKKAGWIGYAFCTAIATFVIFNVVERVHLLHGDRYPTFLAKRLDEGRSIVSLQENECKGLLLMTIKQPGNNWILRCGDFWYRSHTFVTTVNPLAQEGAKQ